MNASIKKNLSRVLAAAGILLIVAAVAFTTIGEIRTRSLAKDARSTAQVLMSLMPQVTDGVPEELHDSRMATLQLNGDDFIGVIDIPTFDVLLPVYAKWDKTKTSSFPCHYSGSLYDGSLILGGSSADGQLNFVKDISIGDKVFFTDTHGVKYSLKVSDIRRTTDVSRESLENREGDVIIFARNPLSFEYTIISCEY